VLARPWIIWRYLLLDVGAHALLALAAVTLLISTGNVLRFLEDLAGTGIALSALGQLLLAILPSFLCYSIPAALIFGVLIAFGRMALDGEIVALQGSGISVSQLLPPILALGAVGALVTAYLMAEVSPRSYARMKQIARDLGKSAALLDPGEFREIGGRVFFFQSRGGPGCPLRGIVIADLGDEEHAHFVTGACGELLSEGLGDDLVFRLASGSIHFAERSAERYRLIRFDELEMPLDVSEQIARRRWPREFTTRELIELEARSRGESAEWLRLLWVQVHRRVAFPLASIVLSIVAIPLGIRPLGAGRSAGALTAVALMGGYWLVASAGEGAAESGQLPPLAGVWLADLLFLALGIALVHRSTRSEA
jgi:lipopolysaccharide export system permease protein